MVIPKELPEELREEMKEIIFAEVYDDISTKEKQMLERNFCRGVRNIFPDKVGHYLAILWKGVEEGKRRTNDSM